MTTNKTSTTKTTRAHGSSNGSEGSRTATGEENKRTVEEPEAATATAGEETKQEPSSLESVQEEAARLRAELEAEKAKSAEYLSQWQRAAADFNNFKRRSEQERAEMAKLFNASLVTQLLPVLDNFERALASVPGEFAGQPWVEGVTLTEKQLRAALEKEGLSAIEARGQKFDPNVHEAVAHETSDEHEEDTVVEEFQKGYKLHDRVIRPSMVKVAKRS